MNVITFPETRILRPTILVERAFVTHACIENATGRHEIPDGIGTRFFVSIRHPSGDVDCLSDHACEAGALHAAARAAVDHGASFNRSIREI